MSNETKLDLRVTVEAKERIAFAASLEGSKVSQFVRASALRRADEVIAEHMTFTAVPSDFLEGMLDALDSSNSALREASRRAELHVKQV